MTSQHICISNSFGWWSCWGTTNKPRGKRYPRVMSLCAELQVSLVSACISRSLNQRTEMSRAWIRPCVLHVSHSAGGSSESWDQEFSALSSLKPSVFYLYLTKGWKFPFISLAEEPWNVSCVSRPPVLVSGFSTLNGCLFIQKLWLSLPQSRGRPGKPSTPWWDSSFSMPGSFR